MDKNFFQSVIGMLAGNKDPEALFKMLCGNNPNAEKALQQAQELLKNCNGNPEEFVRKEFEKDGFNIPF